MNLFKPTLCGAIAFVIATSAYPMAAWDRKNRPELMANNYERNFAKLAVEGSLSEYPWSDDYWATYKGGITYRWNNKSSSDEERYAYDFLKERNLKPEAIALLSPAEKYDLYMGRFDFPLTRHERQRTEILKTVPSSREYDKEFEIPSWEGLCHAWAPATILFKNPRPITVKSATGLEIRFGSSDIKALLTYFLHSVKARTYFLGSRCNLSFSELSSKVYEGKMTQAQADAIMNNAECSDTNAGAFHVVLANQIAKMNEGFVADITRDQEVWNQAVYGFRTKVMSEKEGASAGAAEGTVREITVETEMDYIVEVAPHWEYVEKHNGVSTNTYSYRLELNSAGNIIGGAWLGDERPDFLWKQTRPQFEGYFQGLKALYEQSIK